MTDDSIDPLPFEAEGGLRPPGVVHVATPYPGNEYICPNCEVAIPNYRLRNLSRPPKYADSLNQIFRCPDCRFFFSPKPGADVLRR
jgi:hypothetical protein